MLDFAIQPIAMSPENKFYALLIRYITTMRFKEKSGTAKAACCSLKSKLCDKQLDVNLAKTLLIQGIY